jgi:DNA-binding transcriptional LysR family regulator
LFETIYNRGKYGKTFNKTEIIVDYVDGIRAFVQTARAGTMSAAARELDVSVALLSKRIARLENHLGTRLFHRTTRRLTLSDPGREYLERSRRILAEIEDAESALAGMQSEPRGELRLSASVSFGRKHVVPLVAEFLARFPKLRINLELADNYADVVGSGLDLAIRIGTLTDSSLMARRLAPNHRVICATPDYLARYGTPQTPEELRAHNCLVLRYPGSSLNEWPFQGNDGLRSVRIDGNFDTNNGEGLVEALLAGVGLSMQSTWNVSDELRSGTLQAVLQDFTAPDVSIHAVYPPTRNVSPKVRAFIDALIERIGPEPYWDRELAHILGQRGG